MGLSEPKSITFLNTDSSVEYLPDTNFLANFSVYINLSHKVIIQKRVVYDIFMMFGDVGGLRDFLYLFLTSVFGFFSDEFLNASILRRLFHVSNSDGQDSRSA